MTAASVEIPMARCWAPVEKPWRLVEAGDVALSDDGVLIPIVSVTPRRAGIVIGYVTDGRDGSFTAESDDLVQVLVPAVERDGLVLLADELGARVIA